MRHWNIFPDDSMIPNFYWDAREDDRGVWQPEDGVQAHNWFIPYVTPDGQKAIPLEATICPLHNYAYYEWEGLGCFECLLAARKKARKGE
jgi:hypothetical protein